MSRQRNFHYLRGLEKRVELLEKKLAQEQEIIDCLSDRLYQFEADEIKRKFARNTDKFSFWQRIFGG